MLKGLKIFFFNLNGCGGDDSGDATSGDATPPGPTKLVVKEEAKEVAKEEAKEEVKEEVKEVAKEEVKEEAKEEAKEDNNNTNKKGTYNAVCKSYKDCAEGFACYRPSDFTGAAPSDDEIYICKATYDTVCKTDEDCAPFLGCYIDQSGGGVDKRCSRRPTYCEEDDECPPVTYPGRDDAGNPTGNMEYIYGSCRTNKDIGIIGSNDENKKSCYYG